MSLTNTILAGTLITALAAGGAAISASPPDTRVDSQVTADATTYTVADAGTVTAGAVNGTLELREVTATDGWSAHINSLTGTEIEIDFVSAATRLRFKAEMEDGEVKVEVESRGEARISVPDPSSTSTSTMPSTTSTSLPDSTSSTASTSTTSTTLPDGEDGENEGSQLELGMKTYAVADAGTVTVDQTTGGLVLVGIDPAPGWTVSIESVRADRIELEFEKGELEVRFRLRVESDGRLELRIERKD